MKSEMNNILFFVWVLVFSVISILKCESDSSNRLCEEGWHRFGNKCFKYHNDLAGANFHDAMTICEYVYRATLVTIHSEEEFNFISKAVFESHHAKYSVWIGLIRISNETFVWFDRSELNYTNWGPNEPNNWHSKNYCAVMSSASSARGKWFDVGCTTTYLVMCQKYLPQSTDTFSNETDLESDLSIADQINMELEDNEEMERTDEKSLLTNEMHSLKVLGNVNIVLTTILFIVFLVFIIKYNYNFVFIRRNHQNSDFSSLHNRNSVDI